ncbi:substrate-binding domain-containing protein [Geomobilimonas luticola]|uniref:Substrate-binding domain-containing protein n=1 Tax=Geomobilimonas luticola TaxID=1114878 RepID=A0ABS5SCZ2_9BACT|nr:substrate-binding domain-containing protein [Geomobilimonas luticola]MBT0651897.1 substrate-binding domain-containing protein [Geomobilimonas luticola]
MTWYVKVLAVVFLLIGCTTGCAPSAKVVRVGGEEAAISGFVLPAKETFEEENEGITLEIVRSAPGNELADLSNGTVDAVVSVRSLSDLLHAYGEEKMVDSATLRSTGVGKNDMVIFLNRKNNVKRLSKKQLKTIFAGRVTNWKQLKGANRGIVVVWNLSAEAENTMFIKDILGDAPFAPKLLTVNSYDEVRKLVMETPGAIGIAPSGYIAAGIRVPKAPVVSSPVIVVTRGEPTPNVKKLTDILKDMALLQ